MIMIGHSSANFYLLIQICVGARFQLEPFTNSFTFTSSWWANPRILSTQLGVRTIPPWRAPLQKIARQCLRSMAKLCLSMCCAYLQSDLDSRTRRSWKHGLVCGLRRNVGSEVLMGSCAAISRRKMVVKDCRKENDAKQKLLCSSWLSLGPGRWKLR